MNTDLALLDPLLAYGSIMLFGAMATLTVRDLRRSRQGWLLLLVLLSQTGLALTRLPDATVMPMSLLVVAKVIGFANVGLLWWFCLSLLRDDFRIGSVEWSGFGVLAIIPSIYLAGDLGLEVPYAGPIANLGNIPPIAIVVHVAWVALSEHNADLVEPRRRARLWLAVVPLAALLIALVSETMDGRLGSVVRNGLGILPAQFVLLLWLTRMHPGQLQFEPAPKPPRIAPKSVVLHAKLMQAMDEERVYLRHGLTIDALAGMLGTPPHQLRHLINVGLGFRNFAAFLNAYRLNHAKLSLADAARARETVLTIAYESGFASLPSFNRAFRTVEGQTPTDFRSAALMRHAQS